MDPSKLLNALSDSEKSKVIRHALPGIDAFLKEILPNVNLNPEAEQRRRQYLEILENEQAQLTASQSDQENAKSSDNTVCVDQAPGNDPLKNTVSSKLDASDDFWTANDPESTDCSALPTKDVVASKEGEASSHQLPDTNSPTPTDVIIASDISAEFEVLDWESDTTNGNEEGYCTGDNMCLDPSVRHFEISPNESGEIYTGVLYIREYPGWQKRWFTLNDHCLKCFQHRTDTKMLFEIPLRGARLVPTERKKSRVYPIILSVPKIKECITFAATEENTRQEWRYVLTHVIRQLEGGGDVPVGESVISFSSLLQGKPVCHQEGSGEGAENHTQVEMNTQHFRTEGGDQQSGGINVSKSSGPQSPPMDRNKNSKDLRLKESIVQWQVSIDGEDEIMEPSFCASMDEDESFKELQACLPEILQGRKPHTQKKEVKRVLSTGDLPGSAYFNRPPSPSRRSILSTSSSEGLAASMSDLPTKAQVKRQTSLANSLTTKASRVKSRITSSFFKKGKKGEEKIRQYASKSTTFSGYLLRLKGSTWKTRWCVVKENTLFCYKDFGVGATELEIPLPGKSVQCIAEGNLKQPFVFVIGAEKESFSFAAENDAELEEWMMVLTDEIKPEAEEGVHLSPGSSAIFVPALEGDSRSESPNLNKTRKPSPNWRKDRTSAPASAKKSILSALGHKFNKSKTKYLQPTPGGEVSITTGSVDGNGFVIVPPREGPADNSSSVAREPSPQPGKNLVVPNPSRSGFLNQCVHSDTWLKCWVKLEDHFLHIHDDKDRADAVVVKFKLSNCVVLDAPTADRPHVIEIRRNRSQPIRLQAPSQEECDQWKVAILESIIESPLPARRFRPLPAQSSLDETQPIPKLSLTSGGDSSEQEEVFKAGEQGLALRLDVPLNPSPRPSTAGDVSSVESEEDGDPRDTSKADEDTGRCTRLRSFSEGEQDVNLSRKQKPLVRVRRSLSNALLNLDVAPTKKRRYKTLSGIKVPPELLVNLKHSSCLYLKNKALWSKRWAILQADQLHLFKRADDTEPCVSINIQGCEVRSTSKKTKKFAFELTLPAEKGEYCLAADNQKEMRTWMDFLKGDKTEERQMTAGKPESGKQTSSLVDADARGRNSVDAPHRKLAIIDAPKTEEPGTEAKNTGNDVITSECTSDMRSSAKVLGASDSFGHHSDGALPRSASCEKLTSLDAVLRLLQDQQLVQQIGQRKFDKARKVQNAWKRSAVAARGAARDQPASRPETPDGNSERNEPVRRRGSSVGEARYRASSKISLGEFDSGSSAEILERFDKLAEEEKQRALKTETLLKKRRNSLNLEKDVLEKKLVKGHEKKTTMKKLLGKDENADAKEDLVPAEKRLGDVEQELENIQRNIDENRRQRSEVLENLNTLKTRTVRKYSFRNDATRTTEERRAAFRSSPSESASSQGSVDDRSARDPDSLPRTPEDSRKKSGVETLAALEQELRKFSPLPRRAPDARKKRVSISSEGTASPDDGSTKGSPTPAKKSEIRPASGEGVACGETLLDSTQLRRRKFSGSSRVSFHKLSVEIPTEEDTAEAESISKVNAELKHHKISLVDALSQIKDFEEFAAGSLTEKFGNPKMA